MGLFPRMLDWIQQIWETLQTRVESLEWSCEVDHIPLVSLMRKRQRQRVSNRFYSLLAGNSDSAVMCCKMYTDKLQRRVRRLETQRAEEQFGNNITKEKTTVVATERGTVTLMWLKITLRGFVVVVTFFLLQFNIIRAISSFFLASQKPTTCLISLIDFGKSWKWRSSPCAFVQAWLWAIKWICGWNILFKIRCSRSNGVTV